MATYYIDVLVLHNAFFLSKIFAYFGVNFSNEDPVEMGHWMIFVMIYNIKMGVEYDFKKKTTRYVDESENIQAPPPPIS